MDDEERENTQHKKVATYLMWEMNKRMSPLQKCCSSRYWSPCECRMQTARWVEYVRERRSIPFFIEKKSVRPTTKDSKRSLSSLQSNFLGGYFFLIAFYRTRQRLDGRQRRAVLCIACEVFVDEIDCTRGLIKRGSDGVRNVFQFSVIA
jgi:hypothetical protein